MNKINNIAKNTSFLTLALIGQKIISFTYFALLARNIGAEDLGKYYFAISFTTIFSIILDFGLNNLAVRETAKNKDDAQKIISSVIRVKLPLAILSLILVFLSINLLHSEKIVIYLTLISSVSMLLDSFTASFFAIIRGFHNLKYESISSIVFQLVVVGIGLPVLYTSGNLYLLLSALVGASVFNFVFSWSILRFKFGVRIDFSQKWMSLRNLLSASFPFGMFAVFQKLYMYLDTVLLSFLAGFDETGIYQVAFKIVFALQFLPMAFTAALYPAMSDYWLRNREQLKITFERALSYLAIISLPISAGVIAVSDKILKIFKSEFASADLPLQVIIMSLFFIFVNFPIGSLLNACDRQKTNTKNMAITAIAGVALNFALIPFLGALGASITVLATNFLMFVLGITKTRQIVYWRVGKMLKIFGKALLSSILMGILAIYLKQTLNIFLVIPISGIFYFLLVLGMGVVKREDLRSVSGSFSGKGVS